VGEKGGKGGGVPEPWAEGVGAGVAPDVTHHRREELLLLLCVCGGHLWRISVAAGPTRRAFRILFYLPTPRPLKGNGHGKARAHLSVILYCPAHLPDLHGALSSHSIASAVYLHPITTQRPSLFTKKFYTVSITSNLQTRS